MTDDDAFASFVFDDAPQPGYTSLPPVSLDEINAMLTRAAESRPRLAVAPSRFDEIREHAQRAGLWLDVVASPLLNDNQAVLIPSEAEQRKQLERMILDEARARWPLNAMPPPGFDS